MSYRQCFCCKQKVKVEDNGVLHGAGFAYISFQPEVKEWYGFKSEDGNFGDFSGDTLYEVNDNEEPFPEIAKLICEKAESLFVGKR